MDSNAKILSENQPEAILQAVEILNSGGLVIFPTDTLYGIAGAALNEPAIRRIFEIKARPEYKAMPIMIGSMCNLEQTASDIPDYAMDLARKHWPGPLTLILKRSSALPNIVTAGKDTVGVRIPAHPLVLEILRSFGQPLAVTSANISGKSGADDLGYIMHQFSTEVDLIIKGTLKHKRPSTIVDCTGITPTILRRGALEI